MLYRSTHNQFASFKLSLERERRLVWVQFADDDGLENESKLDLPKNIDRTSRNMEDSISETRALLSPLVTLERTELIESLRRSPSAVQAMLGSIFTEKEKAALYENTKGASVQNRSDEEIRDAILNEEIDRELFESKVDAALENPTNIVYLLQNLEAELNELEQINNRLENAQGLNLESASIQRIRDFDLEIKKWASQVREDFGDIKYNELPYHDFSSWLNSKDATPDTICEKLNIPYTFPNADSQTSPLDATESGAATTGNLLLRIRNLLRRDRKRAAKHSREYGDSEFTSDTIGALRSTVEKMHGHLHSIVTTKAAETERHFMSRMDAYHQDLGTDDLAIAAKTLGMSREGLSQVITDTGMVLNRARGKSFVVDSDTEELVSDPLNFSSGNTATHTRHALDILTQLEELDQRISNDEKHPEQGLFGEEKMLHQKTIEWAADSATRLEILLEKFADDPLLRQQVQTFLGCSNEEMDSTIQSFDKTCVLLLPFARTPENIDPDLHDMLSLDYHDVVKRRNFTAALTAFEHASIRTQVTHFQKTLDTTVIPEREEDRMENQTALLQRIELLRNRMLPNGELSKELKHEVCDGLKVEQRLLEAFKTINNQASVYTSNAKAKQAVENATAEIALLESAITTLENIGNTIQYVDPRRAEDQEVFHRIPGLVDAQGYFSHRNEKIYINTANVTTDEQRNHVIHHETGHAILHLFARKTHVLHNLHLGSYNALSSKTLLPTESDHLPITFAQGLLSLAGAWKIPENISEEEKLDLLMDELWNRHASWVYNERKVSQNPTAKQQREYALFQMLDTQAQIHGGKTLNSSRRTDQEIGVYLPGDEAEEDPDTVPPTVSSADLSFTDINQEILDTEQELVLVVNYLRSYPSDPDNSTMQNWHTDFRSVLNEDIKKKYRTSEIDSEEGHKRLEKLKEDSNFKNIIKAIQSFNEQNLHVDSVEFSGKKGIGAMLDNMTLLSVMDIVKMVKDGVEDLKRMWERSSQMKRNEIGEAITSIIPDNNIWFMGVKYAGQLKHEYKKRGLSSELEEVNKWKEAFKELDPYELGEMLGNVENKDQLRAIIELLYDTGRLDWNDEELWKNLIKMSGAPMPIEACRNDDILRDTWLRTMITDIWDDKNKYYDWRRTNDSNYASGMEKFTETVDQLSNIEHGLDGNLKRQLEAWKLAIGPPRKSIPNSVNPHIYEKVLKYSIENGKMTMEHKFFYLVQGVRYGLLSIDRLRVLAGEKGGVLMKFPFIDYFYGRNNSFREIEAIGRRLEEKDHPNEPGSNTTMWIQLEVMRDENVRRRVGKAADRVLENIDHEDIPTLIGQLSYNQVNGAADVVSGGRQKITREGWKNAYTGFATKFKAFARLSQMEGSEYGLARFSEADAQNLANTITSYVQMDNILTQNARLKDGNPTLSWTEYEQEGPSTGGVATKVFRNSNNAFINKLLENLDTVHAIDWNKFKTVTQVDKDAYLNRIQGKKDTVGSAADATKVYKATEVFSQLLSEALVKNTPILTKTLQEFADKDAKDPLRLREEFNRDELTIENTAQFFQAA